MAAATEGLAGAWWESTSIGSPPPRQGFALDVVEEIKGLFQREDPWANLRHGNHARVRYFSQ